MTRVTNTYKPTIGQVSAEVYDLPGVSHRLLKIGSVWAHTRYEGQVLALREELTTEEATALLCAAQDRGDAISGPAKPEWGIQVYIIREEAS